MVYNAKPAQPKKVRENVANIVCNLFAVLMIWRAVCGVSLEKSAGKVNPLIENVIKIPLFIGSDSITVLEYRGFS